PIHPTPFPYTTLFRSARALRLPHDRLEQRLRYLEATGVQPDQLGTPLLVREWKLDRLVDPAGAGRQRRLELIGAVRRENEDHIGDRKSTRLNSSHEWI